MPGARIPIDQLPVHTTPVDTDLLVIQNGPTTKKMAYSVVTGATVVPLANHISDPTAAHAATAVSATPSGGTMTGTDVQAQLGQAQTAISGLTSGKQPLDADLTTIAGLTATTNNVIQSAGSAWASRTPAQLKATLGLVKGDVGLGNVDNTSDANKPVSTAQAAADALKVDKTTAVTTSAPLSGGGDLSTTRALSIATFAGSTPGVVPTSSGGTATYLRADGTWVTPPGLMDVEGAIDAAASALLAGTHSNITVTYDDAANAISLAGTAGGGGGITTEDAVDATAAALAAGTHTNITVTYNDTANSISLAATGGGTGVTDGDKGDIVVSATGATWMFDTAVVTAAAKTVLDDATVAAMLTTLGGVPTTRTITTTAPLTGGGNLTANRTLDIDTFTATVKGAVPPPTTATGKFLKDDGTWAAPAAPAVVTAQTIETVSGTTYSVVAGDANKIKRLTGTATITLGTALPVGERVDFVCIGGPATFALGGATWDVAPTPSAVARAIGSVVSAVKMGATTWMLTGDLA